MSSNALTTLSRRRFVDFNESSVNDYLNEHGLLSSTKHPPTMGVEQLFENPAVLVLAPPWTGKTFVAKQVREHLRNAAASGTETNRFGHCWEATLFHRHGTGGGIQPVWWTEWTEGEKRACWIVDALDEDSLRQRDRMHEILDLVEELDAHQRMRLRLLMFSRESEQPPRVLERLAELYPDDALVRVRLMPPDEAEARVIVGSQEKLDKVYALIQRNQLKSIARYPSVLKVLANSEVGETLSPPDMWRMVLGEMLCDTMRGREDKKGEPIISERFRAASRFAATLTFSEVRRIAAVDTGRSSAKTIPDFFPQSYQENYSLREAAKVALESGVFHREGDPYVFSEHRYAFAEHHVQEWLTAFALQSIPLNRLKPLMVDADGTPFKRFRGVQGILYSIAEHESVRAWITEINGGVPPHSDAAPWTLPQAVRVLDRLQELARSTEFGLSLGLDSGLENLETPGLGEELAKRLAERELTASEKRLLLDVALKTKAREVVPIARDLIRDSGEPGHVRSLASYLLQHLGEVADFQALESFVRKSHPETREERIVVSNVIRGLFRSGLWTFAEALKFRPSPDPGITDATAVLEHELKAGMALADARELLRTVDWDTLACGPRERDPAKRTYRRNHGLQFFVSRAIELLSEQEDIGADDYQLLQPVVLIRDEAYLLYEETKRLAQVFCGDREARRNLFKAGIEQDSRLECAFAWRWQWVLTAEDLEWLAKLLESQSESSPKLWNHLLILAYASKISQGQRNRIRKCVKSHDKSIIDQFDGQRRKVVKQHQQLQRTLNAAEQNAAEEQIELQELVKDCLENAKIQPEEQLYHLSRLCFVEEYRRPTNVIGDWENLPDDLRSRVIDICEKNLKRCKPTAIPHGPSFPSAIIHEAHAFVEVLRRSRSYRLDVAQIRKWLPATLRFMTQEGIEILHECWAADQAATEDVVRDVVKLELSYEGGGSSVAANLPSECWSQRLVAEVATLLDDETLHLSGRCGLLKVLAVHAPTSVSTKCDEWTKLRRGKAEDRRKKRTAAIDTLLQINPSRAIPLLSEDVKNTGPEALRQMESLIAMREESRVGLQDWMPAELEQLCGILHTAFDPETDPKKPLGVVITGSHVEGDLRQLRDSIPNLLFQRNRPGDQEALERLDAVHADVATWHASAEAQRDAGHVLQSFPPLGELRSSVEGDVSFGDVIRFLDDADYYLIRSSADLQSVLIDELTEIGKTANEHLSMLYGSTTRKKAGHKIGTKKESRKRLHEEALQAYLHCRLQDRLPNRIPVGDTLFHINREPLGAKNRHYDLKAEAPTVGGTHATVIIEVKWSDNKEVSTSLMEQLGMKYLIEGHETHGIYFVGWCGPGGWRRSAVGKRPRPRDCPKAWDAAFRAQAQEFAETHSDLRIEPFVCDLRWDSPEKQRGKRSAEC